MITCTGKNLDILICSEYKPTFNWMSFAAWSSISKFLPDSNVCLTIARNSNSLRSYNWAYKVGIKVFAHQNVGLKLDYPYLNKIYGLYVALKENLVKQPVMVIDVDVMALRLLSDGCLDVLNKSDFAVDKENGPIWFFNNQSLEKIKNVINTIVDELNFCGDKKPKILDYISLTKILGSPQIIKELCGETHEKNATIFTHYKEKCGNFYRKDHENDNFLVPFREQVSLRTLDMSVNEKKVFDLWSKMYMMFETLS